MQNNALVLPYALLLRPAAVLMMKLITLLQRVYCTDWSSQEFGVLLDKTLDLVAGAYFTRLYKDNVSRFDRWVEGSLNRKTETTMKRQ